MNAVAKRTNRVAWGLVTVLIAVFIAAVAIEMYLPQSWAARPRTNGNACVINLTLAAFAVLALALGLKTYRPESARQLLRLSGLIALAGALAAFTGLGYVGGGVILLSAGGLLGVALLGIFWDAREWKMVWATLVAEGCLLVSGLLLLFTRAGSD